MKSRSLAAKLRKLEKQAGMGTTLQIPQDLKTVFFYDLEEGQSPGEVNEKIEKQKAELVEKYGRRILRRLHFIVFEVVSSDLKNPSEAI